MHENPLHNQPIEPKFRIEKLKKTRGRKTEKKKIKWKEKGRKKEPVKRVIWECGERDWSCGLSEWKWEMNLEKWENFS